MFTSLKKISVSALIIGLLCCAANASAMSGFAGPPGATVQWVSQNTKVLGMQMRIRRFESPDLSVEEVLDYYRQRWDLAADTDNPPWKMIGTEQGDEFWNVQVQPKGRNGSWGYLSVSDLPEYANGKKRMVINQGSNFPKMAGSLVINDLRNSDYGSKARTLQMQNQYSVSANASFYRQHYGSKGFASVIDNADAGNKNHVFLMTKGSKEVSLTIHKMDGVTKVVANEVDYDN